MAYTYNGTEYGEQVGTLHKTLFILIWSIAVLLNATSSILLCQVARGRPSWANILILAIALNNMCILVLGITPGIVSLFVFNMLYNIQGLCYYQSMILNALILLSFFIVALVSIDQYLAISHPFMYSTKLVRDQKRAMKIIVSILLLVIISCITITILPIATLADNGPLVPPIFCYYGIKSKKPQNIIISSINIAVMILISLVVIFCDVCIGIGLYNSRQHSNMKRNAQATGHKRHDHQHTNLAKLAVVVAIVFLTCNLPFVVCNLHPYIHT